MHSSTLHTFTTIFTLLCPLPAGQTALFLKEEVGVFLFGTGVACILLGSAYKLLTIDFIPDFIPLIGKLDDELLGGGLQLFGLLCSAAGLYVEFIESNDKQKPVFGFR